MTLNLTHYPHHELLQWYNSAKFEASYKPIFKSGSTSFKNLLGCDHITIYDEEHHRPHYPARAFTVLRDPVDRVQSIYREMIAMNKTRGCESLEEWLAYIQDYGYYDKHQLPQSFWLKGTGFLKLYTLDTLDDCLRWIGAEPAQFPHLNKRKTQPDQPLTPTSLSIIKELYKEDFKIYEQLDMYKIYY